MEKIEITRKMLKDCEIPESKYGITMTWDDGNEFYEDETYIGWNGLCVEKLSGNRENKKE